MVSEKRLEARKKYYYRYICFQFTCYYMLIWVSVLLSNIVAERKRAREFAQRRKSEESSEARELRTARHRQAQARYRKANHQQIAINEFQRRRKVFLAREREADEEEFMRLMNAQDSDEET
ncbi:hypothetical protein BJ165DRAFT_1403003 [Panaeolus papilionaceus]|nr:hypothetical protein BJ165DRAFT_1403003 [Panaeolus papilionaceus]